MSVSSLQEVTVGVANLEARRRQFEAGLGLSSIASGAVTSTTAWRLFDLPTAVPAAVLAQPKRPAAPRIRLVEAPPGSAVARPQGLQGPGALGVGLSVSALEATYARLERSDVRFLSPPLSRPVTPFDGDADIRAVRETYGRSADGDFLVLTEAPSLEPPVPPVAAEPRYVSFVVTNLDACMHFMRDVLEKDGASVADVEGAPFDSLLGLGAGVRLRLAMPRRSANFAGGVAFVEFERRLEPPPRFPAFGRGVCRLRFDTRDLHATLARVPGGGGSLVRGPSGIDDPVLGRGLVALVRAPFAAVIELWQTA